MQKYGKFLRKERVTPKKKSKGQKNTAPVSPTTHGC